MGGEAAASREFGGFFSSARGFELLPGLHVPRGYHIDFRLKARGPWPPPWLGPDRVAVDIAQWGLGAYERFLHEHGEEWLAHARACADHLVERQDADGAWRHAKPYHHTFPLAAGWISAMAQGQGASLLVRLHAETADERYAEAALRALPTMPLARLGGGELPEEYPTEPPSFVLNGAVFALWGLYDVWQALGEAHAGERFRECADTLAANVGRWDLGWWSRYDLFPHPVPNVASPAYHLLHQSQLEAMHRVDPRPELLETRDRFAAYQRSAAKRRRAFVQKVLFRLLVPRRKAVARKLPWSPFFRRDDL
jgi:hypothetical protein